MKIEYYLKKLKETIQIRFQPYRIKRFGLVLAIDEFLIFLLHRRGTRLEHWITRKRDLKVQKYVYENYKEIIERYRDKK